jgi:predicted pyridoxine 5'-phosphate oxidase superfamily flavin-nucleotide-binding protein
MSARRISVYETVSPFHPGEIEAQLLAGGGAPGGGIRDFMNAQHRAFFQALPFIVVGSVDAGWPVATILAGEPGFVSAPDPHTLRVKAALHRSDPAHRSLVAGAPAGILGIQLATRRRNRANGVIASVDSGGFVLDVQQSFGNCPQYIHPRDVQAASGPAGVVETLPALDGEARGTISGADTFFVATAARTEEREGGVDVSHRGGETGFVRLTGSTLTVPDYSGNRYFNTLGNLVSNPRAALLFVDFARGDFLHLQGTVEIVWDGPEVAAFPDAERIWRFRVERAYRKRTAVPLRWTQLRSG